MCSVEDEKVLKRLAGIVRNEKTAGLLIVSDASKDNVPGEFLEICETILLEPEKQEQASEQDVPAKFVVSFNDTDLIAAINGKEYPFKETIKKHRKKKLTETEYVSLCLSKVKRLSQTHNIHAWIVAHPTKMQKLADGSYGVPTAYDISGSAHFRNKADACLCVWRDLLATDGATELHIQKMRFGELGRVGMVELTFDATNGRYKA